MYCACILHAKSVWSLILSAILRDFEIGQTPHLLPGRFCVILCLAVSYLCFLATLVNFCRWLVAVQLTAGLGRVLGVSGRVLGLSLGQRLGLCYLFGGWIFGPVFNWEILSSWIDGLGLPPLYFWTVDWASFSCWTGLLWAYFCWNSLGLFKNFFGLLLLIDGLGLPTWFLLWAGLKCDSLGLLGPFSSHIGPFIWAFVWDFAGPYLGFFLDHFQGLLDEFLGLLGSLNLGRFSWSSWFSLHIFQGL